jgi:hypothetical protein
VGSPNLDYTQPPVDAVMPATPQLVCLWFFGGFTVLLTAYALYLGIRRRSWLPILFVLAGLFTVLLEPIADVMGNAIHSPVGQDNAFTTNGHPIPWHIVLAYPWYFGAAQVFLFDRFRKQNITPAFWWKTFAVSFVAVTAVEQIPLHFHLWVYYGYQPHQIGMMPIWMSAANTASVLVPAIVVYKLFPRLTGWKQLLVLGLVPSFAMAGHAAAGLPIYNALGLKTEDPSTHWIIQVASLATVGLSFLVVWACIAITAPSGAQAPSPVAENDSASADSTETGRAPHDLATPAHTS